MNPIYGANTTYPGINQNIATQNMQVPSGVEQLAAFTNWEAQQARKPVPVAAPVAAAPTPAPQPQMAGNPALDRFETEMRQLQLEAMRQSVQPSEVWMKPAGTAGGGNIGQLIPTFPGDPNGRVVGYSQPGAVQNYKDMNEVWANNLRAGGGWGGGRPAEGGLNPPSPGMPANTPSGIAGPQFWSSKPMNPIEERPVEGRAVSFVGQPTGRV